MLEILQLYSFEYVLSFNGAIREFVPAMLFIKISFWFVFNALVSAVVDTVSFTAVSEDPYTERLYWKIRNEDPPADDDQATTSARMRNRICGDIMESKYFVVDGMEPVNSSTVFHELKEPQHSDIFQQMYTPSVGTSPEGYTYSNLYTSRKFEIIRFVGENPVHPALVQVKEYAFVCLLRNWETQDIVPFYVSKEYDISEDSTFKVGRFVFWKSGRLLLAEEPARVYPRQSYNVELHYLEQRQNHQPEVNSQSDPVCKFALLNFENQHHRLCATVMASSYFEDVVVGNPTKRFSYTCNEEKISFRTPEGIREAGNESYRELMIYCHLPTMGSDGIRLSTFYISRAYSSKHVFVYSRESPEHPLYLENLSTRVNIVREVVRGVHEEL